MLKDYTMTPNRAGIPVWRPAQPVIGREDEHQTAMTNWARMMRTQYPALTLYHHIPNGGLRDKRTAARLIGQGVLIGVPDVFIPAADVEIMLSQLKIIFGDWSDWKHYKMDRLEERINAINGTKENDC